MTKSTKNQYFGKSATAGFSHRLSTFLHKLLVPFIVVKNWFFLMSYPFMAIYNHWTGRKRIPTCTFYDLIPEGWRKAFGKQMLKELKIAWIKTGKSPFYFTDIKEKWGKLEAYTCGANEEIEAVLEKYNKLSQDYCLVCGSKAEYKTQGYISYLCERCFIDSLKHQVFESDEELLKYIEKYEIRK